MRCCAAASAATAVEEGSAGGVVGGIEEACLVGDDGCWAGSLANGL